mgnify:CR=1 FL=1
MNVFFLDDEPRVSARYHADKHVGKMLLEACQMMSTGARRHGFDGGYASAYENHPMTVWVGDSKRHYNYVWELALALAHEHIERFGTEHKSQDLLPTLSVAMHTVIPNERWRNPPRCMPDEYKIPYDECDKSILSCHVQSYRDYYRKAKAHLHGWRNGVPSWV